MPGLQDVPVVQYLFSNKKVHDIRRSVLVLVTLRAAVQVSAGQATTGSESMGSRMHTLRQRFGFGSNVAPNVDAILRQL